MKNLFLAISGIIFTLIALLHLLRLWAGWPATIGSVQVPTTASLWAGGLAFLLAVGCFLALRQKQA